MIFRGRADAGRQLARQLLEQCPTLREQDPIVLALSNGAVTIGLEIAAVLGAPLDIWIAQGLAAPAQAAVQIGAVAEGGGRVLDTMTIRMLGVPEDYLRTETDREVGEVQRRIARLRGHRPPPRVAGRTVVLATDGMTTGLRARAAIASLRRAGARQIVLAVPVCVSIAHERLSREADLVITGAVPERFFGLSACYDDFSPVSDEEASRLLARANGRAPSGPPARVRRLGPAGEEPPQSHPGGVGLG